MIEIIKDLDKLGQRADEIDLKKDNKLVRDTIISLKDTIREKNLVYLTAPQIDVPIRVFVINFNGNLRSFVNPVISETKGFELSREKCNSLDGEYIRPRANDVRVMYQTPLGKIESRQMLGQAAIVFQHAVDHLDGLTLRDVGLEITEEFDKASDDERVELINMYLESLDLKRKEIEKEIEENPELKQVSDAIDFLESVQKGETVASIENVKIDNKDIEVKEDG
ncbi:MAG: peptide deformylase [Methanobrevibacter sp.]|nr:peptide deformylase [Methanobrevibacter sp.]